MKAPWIVEGVKARAKTVEDDETSEDEGRGLDELELRALVAEGASQFARWGMAAEAEGEAPHRHVGAWWPLVATMLFTGLRFGEASALRWDDIDRAAGTITIRRAHWHGIIGHPKSRLSRRVIVIPEPLATILDEHRARLMRWQLPGVESGLAFPSPMTGVTLTRRKRKGDEPTTWTIGPIPSKSGPRGAMERLATNARIELAGRPTLHCLRHSLNNLLRQHASELVRQSLMGHDEAQLRRYSQVGLDEKRAAMGAVVARIGGERP
jgi:integrase